MATERLPMKHALEILRLKWELQLSNRQAELSAGVSPATVVNVMRRAAAAHGEHEKRIGKEDPDWPDWYAAYMVAEAAGDELPR